MISPPTMPNLNQKPNSSSTSLYIKQENQSLLWYMIHKSNQIDSVFSQQPEIKENWFRKHIADMHAKYPNVTNKDHLLSINRDTIRTMMTDLQQRKSPSLPPQRPQPQQPQPQQPPQHSNGAFEMNSFTGKYTRMEPRSTHYANAFEMRQKEYQSMMKGPLIPTPIQFEQIEDKKIQNMEELAEQYRRMRELEIPTLPSSSSSSSSSSPTPTTNVSIQPTNNDVPPPYKLKLSDTEELSKNEIVLDIRPLSKRVHWQEEEGEGDRQINDLYNEISSLKQTIAELSLRIEKIEQQQSPHPLHSPSPQPTHTQPISSLDVNETIVYEMKEVNDINAIVERIQRIAAISTTTEMENENVGYSGTL